MASGAKWVCMVVALAVLVGLAACSGDKGSTEPTGAITTTAAPAPQPPPPPARPDGRMPENEFQQFTTLDDDVAAGLEQWTADARECIGVGSGGDLEGFRSCIGGVLDEADAAITEAGSNSTALSGQLAQECLDATTAYAAALSNLRAATSLARGFADSLDVKSMRAAMQTLAKGGKQYKAARAQVRAACDPA